MILLICGFALGVLSTLAVAFALQDTAQDPPRPVLREHPAFIAQLAQRFGGLVT